MDVLLVPFKAKQLLSHLLSELNEEQVSMAETLIREVLFRNIDTNEMRSRLDMPYEKGGGGWNKIRAEHISERVDRMLEQVKNLKEAPETAVPPLASYLENNFHLTLDEHQRIRLRELLELRVQSKIGQVETQKRLDLSVSKGGVGLHRQTAEKMSREIEILMLLKYS